MRTGTSTPASGRSVSRIHWGWYVLSVSFLTAVISYTIRLGYGVILPEMVKSFGINRGEAGIIYSVFFLMYTVFSPIVGNLTDRLGGRQVITLFCTILTFGVVLMGRASNLVTAILFFGIAGIGISATWAPVITLTARWFSAKRRGFVLGIISLGSFLGYGLLGLIFPLVLDRYSWRMGWAILGGAALVMTVMNGALLRNDPEDLNLQPWGDEWKSPPQQAFRNRPAYAVILRRGAFWQIGISYFFISFCYYTFISFIVTYGTMEIGVRYRTAAAFASVLAFGGLAGSLPISALSDLWGRSKTIFICELLITISILLLILAQSKLWMIFIALSIYGIFFGPIFPLYGACSRDYFEKEVAGTVLGTWTLFYGVGASVAPFVAGYLSDLTGTFRWSFGLAAFAALVAGLVIAFLGKPRDIENKED